MSDPHDHQTERPGDTIDSVDTQISSAEDSIFASKPGRPPKRPASVDEFMSGLLESGLVSQDDLATLREQLTREGSLEDVDSVAQALVRFQKLTEYQAHIISQGHTSGLVLGNYVILEKLGQGGMGMVFKARHQRMKRLVAIKILPPNLVESDSAIQRFHREVEAASKLEHFHICQAHDADESEGLHFLVMEYIEGPNLTQYVRKVGPLSPANAVLLVLQAARGLAHAHHLGIIHRDIKPSNLLLNKRGEIKILDMGLARFTESEADEDRTDLTHSGRVMGTVDYMSPEQALDAKRADERADIYSLGCTLFFLLTGRAPAPEGSLAQKLLWHQNEPVPSLSESGIQVPQELDELFTAMVEKSHDQRIPSMDMVIEELEQIAALLPAPELPEVENPSPRTGAGDPSTHRSSKRSGSAKDWRRTRSKASAGRGPHASAETWLHFALFGVPLAVLLGIGTWWIYSAAVAQPEQPENKGLETAGRPTTNSTETETKETETPPPKKPYEDLLAWTFEHAGKVGLDRQGSKTYVSDLGQVPNDTPYSVIEVDLAEKTIFADDLQRLAGLPGVNVVRTLNLSQTGINNEALPHLSPLVSLGQLDLSKNIEINDQGLDALKSFPNLSELDLSGTRVTDEGLAQLDSLKELRFLYLADTELSDRAVDALLSLPKLERLDLTETRLSPDGFQRLSDRRISVTWSGSEPNRALANRLLTMGAQLTLRTRRDQNTLEVNRRLDLPRFHFDITKIVIHNPQFQDQDLLELLSLPELQELDLRKSSVTVAGLTALKDSRLRKLHLGDVPISPEQTQDLKKLLNFELLANPARDLTVTQWALEKDGRVTIQRERAKTQREVLTRGAAIPQSLFIIVELDFSDNQLLQDDDLELLAQLKYLETLNLSRTRITDAGLERLEGCERLSELTLNGTSIDGSCFAALKRLPALATLGLAETSPSPQAFEQLALFPKLSRLWLDRTPIQRVQLAQLQRRELQLLSLTGTAADDTWLDTLTQFASRKLQVLHIGDTAVSDAGIERLQQAFQDRVVQHRELDGQRLAARWMLTQGATVTVRVDDVTHELTTLEQLPDNACQVVGVRLIGQGNNTPLEQFVEQLSQCPSLTSLNIDKAGRVTESLAQSLGALSELRSLTLSNCSFQAGGIAQLTSLVNLTELSLNTCNVRGADITQLAGLSKLRKLELSDNSTSLDSIRGLRKLTQLTSLDLRTARLVPASDFVELADLTALQSLNLSGTNLKDVGVASLKNLGQLQILKLARTGITNDALESLQPLGNLIQLDLQSNRELTGAALEAFQEHKQLRLIEVSGTQVTKEEAEAFEAKTQIQVRGGRFRPVDPPGGGRVSDNQPDGKSRG